ncbi:MAG: SH3 domain-containing protein [Caldilineaceae bacterium SB0665_bin_25]|nr:SH3 domain-containing protein [Caldilineaceae bacterium SB0665_bin_25]
MRRSIAVTFVLVVLVALPVYAQQSGITLESLSARIETLVAGQQYVLQRVAALETTVAVQAQPAVMVVTSTPIPSDTPIPTSTPEPTETVTREPSATPAATAMQRRITVDRRLSLRRGPGNSHSIVIYVERNSQLEILGRNLAGSWIQVSYNDEIGWLPARYADDVTSIPIVATPTPLPKNTVAPTGTPVPTATTEALSQEAWEYMIEFAKRDTLGMGRNPAHYTDRQYEEWTGMLVARIREAAKNCEMDFMDLAKAIDEEALLLEETGIPKRLDAAARWDFARTLTEFWDESIDTSCKRRIAGRRLWIIANYGDDE